jgi:GNAT superfamily N-acetyltransferase
MDDFLTDLSPAALALAVEENLYAFTPFSHKWKETEVYAGKDVCWCVTDVAFPICNAAFHTYLKPEQADRAIETFLTRGQKRNVPLQWFIGHDVQPADLGERLAAHGFTTPGQGAGMAIDLKEMNEDVPLPAGLKIIEVKDNRTLKTWCHVTAVGFGIPPHAEPALVAWFKRDMKYKQPLKLYLAILDGKPVATSNYYLGEGVCGIYFVATVPEARNRGVGFAVTQRALIDGRALGYRVGILQASKMGEPVYRRMGFKEYCKTGGYTWLPESEKAKTQEKEASQ